MSISAHENQIHLLKCFVKDKPLGCDNFLALFPLIEASAFIAFRGVFFQEKSRRVSLYKELAEDLLEWLEQAITALTEDTDLPRDLIQLRNLQKNLLVFKQDIMHAKLVNKYKIESLHDEITVSSFSSNFLKHFLEIGL